MTADLRPQDASDTLARSQLLVYAAACGIMVANIYLCQPLLASIATGLGVPADQASLVAVLTQIGYASGIFFIVPLADRVEAPKLVNRLIVLTILGLAASAASPNLMVLALAGLALASTSVVAQVLIPYATTQAPDEYRGRIVGTLAGGLVLGILLSRTVSGTLSDLAGSWRAPFILQAAVLIVLRLTLPRYLPAAAHKPAHTGSYWSLLRSMPGLLKHRELLISIGLSSTIFGAFSAVWSTLAFHLASPQFHLGATAAGLFGLWGAPGALIAPRVGRLSDRWGSARVNWISLAAVGLGGITAVTWGAYSLIGLVLAINLVDFGSQSGQVANQARIFALPAHLRGRLNTLYMAATFFGGAVGAGAGGYAWKLHGWNGVAGVVGLEVVLAASILAIGARSTKNIVARSA